MDVSIRETGRRTRRDASATPSTLRWRVGPTSSARCCCAPLATTQTAAVIQPGAAVTRGVAATRSQCCGPGCVGPSRDGDFDR